MAYLWSIIQHLRIHPLIRKDADLLSTQIGEKVDPVRVLTARPQPPQRRRVKPELAAYLQRPRAERMCLRGGEPLRILLDDE